MRVSGWFRDAVGGKRDHLGVHNSGNVVVVRDQSEKTDKDEEPEKEWILVRKKKFKDIYILYYYCLCQMLVGRWSAEDHYYLFTGGRHQRCRA